MVTTRANGGAEAITPGQQWNRFEEEASDLACTEAIGAALRLAKDPAAIRESVKEFDFSNKLSELVAIVEGT